MYLLAELTMSPGGILTWIGVGLIAGWLAGLTMSSGGYGVVADIVLGLVGALLGGAAASLLISGNAGFWGSIIIAFVGACMLITIGGVISPGRAGRT